MEIFRNAITKLLQEDQEDFGDMGILSQDILTTVQQAELSVSSAGESVQQMNSQPAAAVEEVAPNVSEDSDAEIQDAKLSVQLQNMLVATHDTPEDHAEQTDDGYDDGAWVCPYDECVICNPNLVVPMPEFEKPSETHSEMHHPLAMQEISI